MKFIRVDGNIYDVEHRDTIKRLVDNDNFEKVEYLSVNELRQYAAHLDVDGHKNMDKEELIDAIDDVDYRNYTKEIALNQKGELV